MASHGIVYDLFDDRYLELQDVAGSVELLPTLVPYDEYTHCLHVYRMNTGPELFMALLQDFTKRKSAETRKELWTWCVQWKVDEAATHQQLTPPHSPKKPRLAAPSIKGHVRAINPQLMKEGELLRILLGILQQPSSIVPNFIEFLYRWIDYHEGDGMALKAAMHREIPSLWAFDYHPLVFPQDLKKKMDEAIHSSHINTVAEKLAQASQTKTVREKPDLKELQRKVEESERLQYREVQFGIQPPKLKEPLPPLINIPRDPVKRVKFHAACFESRQRAFNLLLEAGMTATQLRDYQKDQEEDPRDTPLAFGRDGLQFYRNDAELAQRVTGKQDKHVDKTMEIAISEKLAFEAQFAGRSATPENFLHFPLIPNRPGPVAAAVVVPTNDLGNEMLRMVQKTKNRGEHFINIIPAPLVGKLKGELFKSAIDKDALLKRWQKLGERSGPRFTDTSDKRKSDAENNEPDMSLRLATSAHNPSLHAQHPAFAVTLTPPQETHGQEPLGSLLALPSGPSYTNYGPSPMPGQLPPPSPQVPNVPSGFNGVPSHTSGSGTWPPSVPQEPNFSGNPTGTSSYTSASGLPPPVYPLASYPFTQNQQQIGPPSFQQVPQLSSSHPVASTPSTPATVPASARLLAAMQPNQSSPTSGQGFQNGGPSALQGSGNSDFSNILNQYLRPQEQPSLVPNSFLAPPGQGIQRTAPSPLRLAPAPSPFNTAVPSLTGASPFQHPELGMPVQIYFREILVPGNLIGPGGAKMGNDGCVKTDAFLVGYAQPGSGKITLSHAIFLSVGVWENCMDRVRKDKCSVLESYHGPQDKIHGTTPVPYRAAYEKLRQAYSMMLSSSPEAREENVTKRWRVTPGRMSGSERGSIWEGWAVGLDKEISMSKQEREGAFVRKEFIDHGVEIRYDSEKARRRREHDELLAEEEAAGVDYGSDMDTDED
ncbi:Herpes-BLLF1 multi-domain protein [Pyrenophora tritici-repentis]|nr:Herpes-BLLF1 multi-domain protein [Pyrenophora tritici-repentis]